MRCTRPVLERCKVGPVEIVERPCGKCPACLSNKAQAWTYRLYAESKLHKKSCFVTLTYDEDSIKDLYLSPTGLYSLDKKAYQNFMKRLRKNSVDKLRFYAVGEYGGQTKRPHFHAIIFGLGVEDSHLIEQAWNLGFVTVGEVTPGSMAYVARYCTKKMYADNLDYEQEGIQREFSLMSNRPGIGANAIDKGVRYDKEGRCYVWFKGRRYSVPQYFKDKIKSAYDSYISRLASQRASDDRSADYDASGRSELEEALQAERNVVQKRGLRSKL